MRIRYSHHFRMDPCAPKTDFCTFWLPASGANGFAYAPYPTARSTDTLYSNISMSSLARTKNHTSLLTLFLFIQVQKSWSRSMEAEHAASSRFRISSLGSVRACTRLISSLNELLMNSVQVNFRPRMPRDDPHAAVNAFSSRSYWLYNQVAVMNYL